jgi:hypothetical protein
MSDAPDPLGKRALFWVPAQRDEEGPRYPDGEDVPGKHALYSDGGLAVPPSGRAQPRSGRSDRSLGGIAGHSATRRPTGPRRPAPPEAGAAARRAAAAVAPDNLERPDGSGMFGSLTLQCSSCRVLSRVDLIEYIVLHLPIWLWRPGRGYTRFMTCPACRRRTWVSATWTR